MRSFLSYTLIRLCTLYRGRDAQACSSKRLNFSSYIDVCLYLRSIDMCHGLNGLARQAQVSCLSGRGQWDPKKYLVQHSLLGQHWRNKACRVHVKFQRDKCLKRVKKKLTEPCQAPAHIRLITYKCTWRAISLQLSFAA